MNGVLAHAHERYRTDRMSRAVVHADAVAGLLVAAALVRPERANRDEISEAQDRLWVTLDDFLSLGIEGLRAVASEIELR